MQESIRCGLKPQEFRDKPEQLTNLKVGHCTSVRLALRYTVQAAHIDLLKRKI